MDVAFAKAWLKLMATVWCKYCGHEIVDGDGCEECDCDCVAETKHD